MIATPVHEQRLDVSRDSEFLFCYRRNGTAREPDEVVGQQSKHGIGRAARCPDAVETEQRVVDIDQRRIAVADRWHAADRKPCLLANERSVGATDFFTEKRRQALFIDAHSARCNSQHGSPTLFATEYQRLRYLPHGAAYCRCGVGRSSCALIELQNLETVAQDGLDLLR